ncbi:MAG: transglutaminase family protein [Rhodococcus sp.]|nr:transglutaminase family protein [Rhodococcus sp. (in: high G+C Gram-positive bacteria)]
MRVVHTTGFVYGAPVTSSYNEARLTPRGDSRQTVVLSRVETDPATRSYRYTDYWGTAVTAFDLHAPHTELEVTGLSVVETEPFTAARDSIDWEGLADARVRDRFDEQLTYTTYAPRSAELAEVAAQLSADRTPDDAVEAACQWVHEEMSYMPGTTGVHTSALEAWSERKGVCQDYAHLTLVLLRSMGIPSRYVSGYLHPKADAQCGETVAGQSHAWIEAWTGGWWGYDPTNAIPVREQHVSVGFGRDYKDVPPLKGIFSGGHATDLEVVVEITRLA